MVFLIVLCLQGDGWPRRSDLRFKLLGGAT